jgi:hypothetical protein
MSNQSRASAVLSRADTLRRLATLKRGAAVAAFCGFGAFGLLAAPHTKQVTPASTGTSLPAAPVAPPSGATQDGGGNSDNADGTGSGNGFYAQGQGGYGFGNGNSQQAPATSSGAS